MASRKIICIVVRQIHTVIFFQFPSLFALCDDNAIEFPKQQKVKELITTIYYRHLGMQSKRL